MSLDLQKISFTVDTTQLDTAATKLAALGKAASGLAKDLNTLDKTSAATAKTQAEANLIEAKAEEVKRKTANATREVTETTKQNTSVLERQQAILEFMTQGYSKGQSSTLAMAKATGILTDDLKTLQDVLQSQRTLTGGDPFDKSLGALKSLQNEFKVLKEVQRLYTAEIPLTQKQMENLALDKLRLIEAMKIEGKSLSEIKVAIKNLNSEYIGLAGNINRVTAADESMAKSKVDAAKATAFLERELARIDNVLEGFSNNLNVTTSNRLMKFREQLKASGVDATQAAEMLRKYETSLKAIDNTNKVKQNQGREEQLKYLARATSVQLGDIGISLAGGQNPFTVLIQQGDQLRGVLNQVEADGVEMKKALSLAFKQIVVGSKDVISALGLFVVGAFNDAGKAIFTFASNLTGFGLALEMARYQLTLLSKESGFLGNVAKKALPAFEAFGAAITSAFGVALGVSVASLLALGVAFVQVTKAQDELTRVTISSGAYLGITTKEAYALSTGLGAVGATTVDAINVMTKLTEGGVIAADAFKMVTTAALELENVGGRSAEKTVEMFNKLGEKPVEVLSEYAIKSGLVNQAEIERINTLVKAGDEITATTEATEILSKATETEAAIMYANLSSISRLWIDVKNGTSDAWGAVQEFAGSDTIMVPIKAILQTIALLAVDVWYGVKGAAESLGGLGAVAVAVMTDIKNLDSNFTMSKNVLQQIKEVDDARQDSYVNALLRINQEGEYSKEFLDDKAKRQAALAKANSDAEKSRLAHEEAMKPWKEYEKKHLDDTLTRQQFINRAIDDANKKKIQGTVLDKKSLDFITTQAGNQWDDGNKKKKTKDPAGKELENYIKSVKERVSDLGIEVQGVVDETTKADKLWKDFSNDPLWGKISQELKNELRGLLDITSEQEKQTKELERNKKIREEIRKISAEVDTFVLNETQANEKLNSEYDLRLSLIGKTAEQQKKLKDQAEQATKLAELNSKYDGKRLKIQQDYEALRKKNPTIAMVYDLAEAGDLDRLLQEQAKAKKVINNGVAVKAAEDYYAEMKKISEPIADALSTALFEGGEAGSKKFRDYLVNLLREKITLNIEANITSMLTSSGNPQGSGILGALDSLTGLISNGVGSGAGSSITSILGGSKNLGNTLVKGAGAASDWLNTAGYTNLGKGFESISNALAPFSKSITQVSDALGYLNVALLATEGKWGAVIGAAIGTAFGGSIGSFIGQKLGGFVDNIFGGGRSYSKGGGIEGSFSSKGFTGNGYSVNREEVNQWNSWMGQSGSDVKTTKALNTATTDNLTNQFLSIQNSISDFSKALGIDTSAIMSYSKAINIETLNTSQAEEMSRANETLASKDSSTEDKEKAQKVLDDISKITTEKFTKLFTDITNEMASLVVSADFIRTGETSSDALARIATSLTVVNSVFAQLGNSLITVSQVGGQTASNLIDVFGGLSKFTETFAGYYSNFYTEQEKVANATSSLSSQFSSLGIVMPAVNDDMRLWYRTEVERQLALDQSIPANARATAALLGLQDEVNSIAPAFVDLDKAMQNAADALAYQQSWQRKLDVLTGKTTQRELEKVDALADADKATRDIILDFYAYEDAQIAAAAATELAKKALEALQTETQKAMTDMVTLWGDLTGAMKEIDKPAATLVEQWRANSAELQTLTQGLADALGELPEESALDKLKNVLSALASATGGIADLNNQIFELKVGQGGANAVGLLQDKERSLYAEMQTSNDPGAVAAKLASTTISRIKLQAEIADKYKNDGFKAQEESLVNIAKLEKENRDKQIEALQKQISAAETLVDVVGGLKNYIAELKFGDLSALNPTDQLSTARSLFESTLAGAQGGDAKAMQNLQGYSSSYLQEAQGYYGGATSEYASIFQSVTGLLDEFSTTPITDIELLTSQLEKLQLIADSSTALQTVTTDTSALQITSLTEIRDALSEREKQLQKQADDAKAVAQAQIDALKEIVAGQEAQIKQHAAEYEVLNTKLTDIGKSLESIDSTNKQVAAST